VPPERTTTVGIFDFRFSIFDFKRPPGDLVERRSWVSMPPTTRMVPQLANPMHGFEIENRNSRFENSQHLLPLPPEQQHLGLQADAGLLFDAVAHVTDEGEDVGARGVAAVDDEVAVHRGELRITDALALQSTGINEASGGITWRVLENAAGARFARLRFLPLVAIGVDLPADVVGHPWRAGTQDRRNSDRVLQLRAVPVVDVHLVPAKPPPFTVREHHVDFLHDVEHPAAHGAGIHPQRATNVARYALEEFEAAATVLGR